MTCQYAASLFAHQSELQGSACLFFGCSGSFSLLSEGMWRRQLPAWDPVTLLAASPSSQASRERRRRAAGREESITSSQQREWEVTFSSTGPRRTYPGSSVVVNYHQTLTWSPDGVSAAMLKTPRWHQKLRQLLFLQSHKLSEFEIRA